MILDPVRFKEHLVRMRRDREMALEAAGADVTDVRRALGGGSAASVATMDTYRAIQREIALLAELHAAVEDSMRES